jgi:release factor glutamine methyltransferase
LDHLEAQTLLLHAVGQDPHDRAWLLLHDTNFLDAEQLSHFMHLVQRRLQHEPLAYLTGWQEFHGLRLQVDKRVLVPRPDTETLVDWALEMGPLAASALDLGTGSGAIAVALKHAHPHSQVCAVDCSEAALNVARANAQRMQQKIQFYQGHWWHPLAGQCFDLVVSNPPYIAEGDPHLAALRFEPLQALTSGADGLKDLRDIIAAAPQHLKPGAWLLLEHGHDQSAVVQTLLTQQGFASIQSRLDQAGLTRCTGGRWQKRDKVNIVN